jgi:hypothetical protein
LDQEVKTTKNSDLWLVTPQITVTIKNQTCNEMAVKQKVRIFKEVNIPSEIVLITNSKHLRLPSKIQQAALNKMFD